MKHITTILIFLIIIIYLSLPMGPERGQIAIETIMINNQKLMTMDGYLKFNSWLLKNQSLQNKCAIQMTHSRNWEYFLTVMFKWSPTIQKCLDQAYRSYLKENNY